MRSFYEDDQDVPNEDVLECDDPEELASKLWLTHLMDDEDAYQYFLPKTRMLMERRAKARIAAIHHRLTQLETN